MADFAIGTIMIAKALATYKTTGWPLVITCVVFLIYASWDLMPGFLGHKGYTWDLYRGNDVCLYPKHLGVPAGIAATLHRLLRHLWLLPRNLWRGPVVRRYRLCRRLLVSCEDPLRRHALIGVDGHDFRLPGGQRGDHGYLYHSADETYGFKPHTARRRGYRGPHRRYRFTPPIMERRPL